MTETVSSEIIAQAPQADVRPPRGGKGGRPRGRRDDRPREKKEFEEEILSIDRVTRVVKGGRRMRFRVTVIIGDRKNRVGVGVGKSGEVATSVQKAVAQAKKKLLVLPLVEGTIPHAVETSFKAAHFRMMPAVEGTGIIAGGSLRKIAALAGVKNLIAKNFGTKNKLATAQAVMKAFSTLRSRDDAPRGRTNRVAAEVVANAEAAVADSRPAKKAVPKK